MMIVQIKIELEDSVQLERVNNFEKNILYNNTNILS